MSEARHYWACFLLLVAPLAGAMLLPVTSTEVHWELGAETGAQDGQDRGSMVRNLTTTPSNAIDHHILLTNENTETLRNATIRPNCSLLPGINQKT